MPIHYGDPLENNGAELPNCSPDRLETPDVFCLFFIVFLVFSVVTISVKRADLDL